MLQRESEREKEKGKSETNYTSACLILSMNFEYDKMNKYCFGGSRQQK